MQNSNIRLSLTLVYKPFLLWLNTQGVRYSEYQIRSCETYTDEILGSDFLQKIVN